MIRVGLSKVGDAGKFVRIYTFIGFAGLKVDADVVGLCAIRTQDLSRFKIFTGVLKAARWPDFEVSLDLKNDVRIRKVTSFLIRFKPDRDEKVRFDLMLGKHDSSSGGKAVLQIQVKAWLIPFESFQLCPIGKADFSSVKTCSDIQREKLVLRQKLC